MLGIPWVVLGWRPTKPRKAGLHPNVATPKCHGIGPGRRFRGTKTRHTSEDPAGKTSIWDNHERPHMNAGNECPLQRYWQAVLHCITDGECIGGATKSHHTGIDM